MTLQERLEGLNKEYQEELKQAREFINENFESNIDFLSWLEKGMIEGYGEE